VTNGGYISTTNFDGEVIPVKDVRMIDLSKWLTISGIILTIIYAYSMVIKQLIQFDSVLLGMCMVVFGVGGYKLINQYAVNKS